MSHNSLSMTAHDLVGSLACLSLNCKSYVCQPLPPNLAAVRTVSIYLYISNPRTTCFSVYIEANTRNALVHCSIEVIRGTTRCGCTCNVDPDSAITMGALPSGKGTFFSKAPKSTNSPFQILSRNARGTADPSASRGVAHTGGSLIISPPCCACSGPTFKFNVSLPAQTSGQESYSLADGPGPRCSTPAFGCGAWTRGSDPGWEGGAVAVAVLRGREDPAWSTVVRLDFCLAFGIIIPDAMIQLTKL